MLAVHDALHLASPARLPELVLLGVILSTHQAFLLRAEDLARREAGRAFESPWILVGDAADLAQLAVVEIAAVEHDVRLLIAQMVRDAVPVHVIVPLARRVADGLQLMALEELLRVEAGAARVALGLCIGAAAFLADDAPLEVL